MLKQRRREASQGDRAGNLDTSWINNNKSAASPRRFKCFPMLLLVPLLSILLLIQIFLTQPLVQEDPSNPMGTELNVVREHSALFRLHLTNSTVLTKRRYNNPIRSSPFAIDILSIGSINQEELFEAQISTWANHPSRRFFFVATEYDDPDPNCHKELTVDDALKICKRCKGKQFYRDIGAFNDLTKAFTSMFSNPEWLMKRKNPSGWMCAQRRLPFALSKVLRLYKEAHDLDGFSLPDYLILVDDDTIVNISRIEEYLLRLPSSDEESIPLFTTPVVLAGCRVRWPVNMVNFTFPFGGYGTFFSKAALERLITPLYCNGTAIGFEQEACERIVLSRKGGSNLGESALFQPGMSVGDLLGSFAGSNLFCVHSDWAIGYFVNFYNISRHAVDDGVWFNKEHRMDNVKEARLHTIDGSEIYRPYQCHSDGEACTSESLLCHRASPDIMKRLYGGGK